jgi:ketosteroid isomerase-like protein
MSASVVMEFIARINRHDVQGIIEMMSHDHIFVDGLGNRMDHGRMKSGWPAYFELFPDYKIEVDAIAADGDTILVSGKAMASYKGSGKAEDSWMIPAAWKALVRGKSISHWQVYCDSAAPLAILAKKE